MGPVHVIPPVLVNRNGSIPSQLRSNLSFLECIIAQNNQKINIFLLINDKNILKKGIEGLKRLCYSKYHHSCETAKYGNCGGQSSYKVFMYTGRQRRNELH